jgi:hypothetical protein
MVSAGLSSFMGTFVPEEQRHDPRIKEEDVPAALQEALEAAYRAQHLAQAPQHELHRIESKVRRTFLESSVKMAIENNQDISSLQPAAAAALVPVPGPKRFITSDATVEKLAEVVAQNPNGIL